MSHARMGNFKGRQKKKKQVAKNIKFYNSLHQKKNKGLPKGHKGGQIASPAMGSGPKSCGVCGKSVKVNTKTPRAKRQRVWLFGTCKSYISVVPAKKPFLVGEYVCNVCVETNEVKQKKNKLHLTLNKLNANGTLEDYSFGETTSAYTRHTR